MDEDAAGSSGRVLLVAVDDSKASELAFEFALNELYRKGDAMHLVHVIPRLHFAAVYGVPPVDFVPTADSNTYETVIQKAEAFIINRFVKKLPQAFQTPPVVHIIKSEVDTDTIGHVLCKKAEELDAAAVVMARHNKGRIAELFLGSVTHYCTHNAKRPVIVVPATPATTNGH